jgi:dipeptidyl aminopeptidase/acylaminoacyl peptidase
MRLALLRPTGAALLTAAFAVAPLAAQPAAAPASGAPRPLSRTDLQGWKTIRASQLSADGRTFAYYFAPNEGDGDLVVRPLAAGAPEKRFPVGEPAPGGNNPFAQGPALIQLSRDGKWLAATTWPKAADAKKLRKDRKPVQTGVLLIDLTAMTTRQFDKVRRFAFAGDRASHLVMQSYSADAAPAAPVAAGPGGPPPARVESADLLVHTLGSTDVLTVGTVGDFSLDQSGRWLAYTIEGRDAQGNGVQLHDLANGTTRVLDSQKALYRRLAWSDSLPMLAVLRGVIDSAGTDTAYTVLGFRNPSPTAAPIRASYTLAGRADAPKGLRVSPDRTPRWSEQGDGLFFGLREVTAPTPKEEVDDEKPNLMIWHWKEARLQSQQIVQENNDRTFSYLAAYWPTNDRFVALTDSTMRTALLLPHDRFVLGTDSRADERRALLNGQLLADHYIVDPRTGARRLALKQLRQGPVAPSPDGAQLLFYRDGHYHVLDAATLATRNITERAPVSFWDTEDDHNVDKPAIAPIGWSRDSRAVVLFDNYDIWKLSTVDAAPLNLTKTGRTEGLRYANRIRIDPREQGIDLTQPLWFTTYGERSKQGGVAKVDGRTGGVTRVLLADASFEPRRARDAEVWITTRQSFVEYPDFWVLNGGALTQKLTNGGAQLGQIQWSSGTKLVDYVSEKNDSLQGVIFLPSGYEAGKKYPTVTYFYEKLSQTRHRFTHPNEVNGVSIHPGVFTSRGYAVFVPDIVYKLNDPGMSAVWCMVPAVKAAIATGIVDPDKVGIQGHSWGGYQTAFLVTQTNIFKAAIAGAPLTDMVSMYSSVYWNTGNANQPIFESSQGRFKGNFIENKDAYERNSPNRFADKVETPLIILHNDKDGAVDFNQGITYYNTLKQLNKEVILLEYPGENHGLVQRGNLKDYQTRMTEWFDVKLRGMPAPDWIKDGVPRLKMEDHLRARKPKPEPPKKIVGDE